jgi:hypothetical protein
MKVKRTCVVELVVDEETERRLRQLCVIFLRSSGTRSTTSG